MTLPRTDAGSVPTPAPRTGFLAALRSRLRSAAAVLPAVLLAAGAAAARADGLIIVPPHVPDRPHERNIPLAVREHRVTVVVDERVAVTEVDQTFVNPNPRQLEGTYLFPMPKGAAIERFSMWIDGKEMAAELLDAAKARDIYEGIVRSMRDPALLEYAEQGLFKARIFPIEAHGEKRVRIRYAEILNADGGTVGYRYGLATERFSSAPLEHCSIAVTIRGSAPVGSVWSPSHRIDAPKSASGAPVTVSWEERRTKPDRDFLLFWRPTTKAVAVTALAHRDPAASPDGTFLLVLSPPAQTDAAPMPKDVVFVVDTSGSMAGQKMEQARGALRFCLRSLGPEDRFGLVPFATEPQPFRTELLPASAENRAAAETFVGALEARGGTAIDDALQAALRMLPAAGQAARPTYVVFLTDGLPTIGDTRPDAILSHAVGAARGARLFVFGVGTDVNTKLLDRLSDDTRGARAYVAETENIEEKVSALYGKLSRPAMTDVSVAVEGVVATSIHPAQLPDLFHGSEALVCGRYAAGGNAVIRLRGKIRGTPVEIVEELRLPDAAPQHGFLPRLWAVRRVGFLLDEIRLRGETPEVRDEVVRLAKAYGIVTPYTSYLIVEDAARGRNDGRLGGLPQGGGDAGPGWGLGGGGGGTGGGGAGGGGPSSAPAAPADAVRRLEAEAAKGRARRESDSGAGAVEESGETLGLRDYAGDKDEKKSAGAETHDLVRHVAGRTFVRRGEGWWEQGAEAKTPRRVVAYSDEYFSLLRARPELARYLSLGRVVLLTPDEAVEIVTE